MVSTSNCQKNIEHQFDSFCKIVIRNYVRDIYDKMKTQKKHLVSLESLTQSELEQLSITDIYDSDYFKIAVYNFEVHIADVLIAQAITSLNKRKQEIILLSFFLDMSNVDIANLLNLTESTVHYHKENALKELKKYLEEHTYES
jgi:RNA polymerase sigma factor (sigma-70 family)